MKRLFIIALLFMLISPALALPDLESQLKGKAMIRESGAPWLNDDAIMYFGADKDGYIKFNSTSGYVELSGVASGVLTNGGIVGSGNDISFAGGDSVFDGSAASGAFTTMSGTNTLSGDVVIAANKGVTVGAGTGAFNFGTSTGAFTTSSGTNTLSGNVAISGSKTFATGTGAVGLNGDVTIAAAKKLTKGVTIDRVLTKTADYTITDTDPDVVFIGAITALAHTTILLPTAADNTGRKIEVSIAGDPGANNVIIDGEGGETINGAATKTNSDRYSSITVRCDGTGWYITSSSGTWT